MWYAIMRCPLINQMGLQNYYSKNLLQHITHDKRGHLLRSQLDLTLALFQPCSPTCTEQLGCFLRNRQETPVHVSHQIHRIHSGTDLIIYMQLNLQKNKFHPTECANRCTREQTKTEKQHSIEDHLAATQGSDSNQIPHHSCVVKPGPIAANL